MGHFSKFVPPLSKRVALDLRVPAPPAAPPRAGMGVFVGECSFIQRGVWKRDGLKFLPANGGAGVCLDVARDADDHSIGDETTTLVVENCGALRLSQGFELSKGGGLKNLATGRCVLERRRADAPTAVAVLGPCDGAAGGWEFVEANGWLRSLKTGLCAVVSLGVEATAFETPEGRVVVVAMNTGGEAVAMSVGHKGDDGVATTLPPRAIQTYLL
jgi:hypothetical protein